MQPITSIRRSEVPSYLHTSEFYLSLDASDEEFPVPSDCLKMDAHVNGLSDLRSILLTMRFWILKTFPPETIEYITFSRNASVVGLLYEFGAAFPRVRNLVRKINESEMNKVCNLTAQFGRVDFLDYITKKRGELDIRTLMVAAEYGRVECLSYCYDFLCRTGSLDLNNCDWRTMIQQGNFKCLSFLVTNDVSLTKFFDLAVQLNSAKCMNYLHEHFNVDCWTQSTMAEAAEAGRLELVKQLHQHGCPWDESAPIAALQANQGKCLKYLIEQRGVPTSSAFTSITSKLQCTVVLVQYQVEQNTQDIFKLNKMMSKLATKLNETEARVDKLDVVLDRMDAISDDHDRRIQNISDSLAALTINIEANDKHDIFGRQRKV